MAELNGLNGVLLGFIVVVIGAVFASSIGNSITSATQLNSIVNESQTLTNNTPVQLSHNQLESLTQIQNASGAKLTTTAYTVNLDSGVVTPTFGGNASIVNGQAFKIDYTYRDVKNSSARAIMGTVLVFFTIGIFLALLVVLNPNFREMFKIGK